MTCKNVICVVSLNARIGLAWSDLWRELLPTTQKNPTTSAFHKTRNLVGMKKKTKKNHQMWIWRFHEHDVVCLSHFVNYLEGEISDLVFNNVKSWIDKMHHVNMRGLTMRMFMRYVWFSILEYFGATWCSNEMIALNACEPRTDSF